MLFIQFFLFIEDLKKVQLQCKTCAKQWAMFFLITLQKCARFVNAVLGDFFCKEEVSYLFTLKLDSSWFDF